MVSTSGSYDLDKIYVDDNNQINKYNYNDTNNNKQQVLDINTDNNNSNVTTTATIQYTIDRRLYLFGFLYSFLCMGCCVALTGPTLHSLGRQSHTTLDKLPFIYTSRSIGVFIGTLIGGVFVDYAVNKGTSILCIVVLCMSIFTCIIPSMTTLIILSITNLIQGLAVGCVDNIAQILLIKHYDKDVGPYMQALHASFGVGAWISPLLAAPFLNKSTDQTTHNNDYVYAYYIIGICILPAVVLLAVLSYKDEWKSNTHNNNQQQFTAIQQNNNNNASTNQSADAIDSTNSSNRLRIVILVGIFLMLYVGCESGFGNYLASYGVLQLSYNEHKSSLLTSIFWLTFTSGRILAVFISIYISTTVMIYIDLIGCIGSLLVISIMPHNSLLLWILTGIYGISVASIYPTAINYAENSVRLSGKHLSVLSAFATCGEALIPLMQGELIVINPTYMMYLQLTSAVCATLVISYVFSIGQNNQHINTIDDNLKQQQYSKLNNEQSNKEIELASLNNNSIDV